MCCEEISSIYWRKNRYLFKMENTVDSFPFFFFFLNITLYDFMFILICYHCKCIYIPWRIVVLYLYQCKLNVQFFFQLILVNNDSKNMWNFDAIQNQMGKIYQGAFSALGKQYIDFGCRGNILFWGPFFILVGNFR